MVCHVLESQPDPRSIVVLLVNQLLHLDKCADIDFLELLVMNERPFKTLYLKGRTKHDVSALQQNAICVHDFSPHS